MRIRMTCFAIICMVLLINTHINTDMVKWWEQIIYKLKKRHYTRLRATDIALEREKNEEQRIRSYCNKRYSYLVTQPGRNPSKQGFTFLRCGAVFMVLRLYVEYSFFISKIFPKATKNEKNHWYWLGK